MPFPRKFKELLESSPPETPDYLYLSYAVCACEPGSCGWYGWTLDDSRCPNCGRQMFRIEDVRFDRAPKEEPREGWVEGIDYEIAPMEYCDDEDFERLNLPTKPPTT
jgi:hypothetical protein